MSERLTVGREWPQSTGVVEWHAQVGGEPQVVVLALAEPAGEGMVLGHERPGAGGGLVLADQDGGAELVPGSGQLVLPGAIEGAGGGGWHVGQVLHLAQRAGRLPGPAPAGGRRVNHGLKLSQGVRVAERVPGELGVGVVRCPRVMDRDAGEGGEHPGGVHPWVPRLSWTVISAWFPAEAEWTQASFPATRNPVSSKCATPAAATAARIASNGAPSAP
jgi:hypothetical protein